MLVSRYGLLSWLFCWLMLVLVLINWCVIVRWLLVVVSSSGVLLLVLGVLILILCLSRLVICVVLL